MLVKTWNEKQIRWREDGFGCLTDMAKAAGKNVSDWLRLKGTREYMDVLSSVMVIPATQLLQVFQGSQHEEQGTWACKQLCIRFAQWCSPEFAVQVDLWIEEIMTKGVVDIRNLTPTEILHATTGRLVEMERQQKQTEQDIIRLQLEHIDAQRALNEVIERNTQIETQLDEVIDRSNAIDAELERITSPDGDYFSILGYANYRNLRPVSRAEASILGREASRLCRERGLPVQKVKDVRFGKVGSYPENVLDELFAENEDN
jgi:hypothetical protein